MLRSHSAFPLSSELSWRYPEQYGPIKKFVYLSSGCLRGADSIDSIPVTYTDHGSQTEIMLPVSCSKCLELERRLLILEKVCELLEHDSSLRPEQGFV